MPVARSPHYDAVVFPKFDKAQHLMIVVAAESVRNTEAGDGRC